MAHICDICKAPANILMEGDGETAVYYCDACYADWCQYDGEYERDMTCPECNGDGMSWDGLAECDYCDGMGYKWWE